ncbi:MAG: hypothetical protein ACLSFT_04080 [Ruminococcus callidus]
MGPNGSGKSNIGDAVRWVLGNSPPRRSAGARWRTLFFPAQKPERPWALRQLRWRSATKPASWEKPMVL